MYAADEQPVPQVLVRAGSLKSAPASHDDAKDVEKAATVPNALCSDGELANDLTEGLEAGRVDYIRKAHLLNKVMATHVGFGLFQWQMFALCGVGWFLDNLWIQGVAIILSQVSIEFGFVHYQFLTLSMYVGLLLGALTWGILADVVGRRLSFNATLLIAGVFGLCAGAANNFVALAALIACMGLGLGGNLPVDGMLFIEVLPSKNQSLLAILAIFWAVGQVVASLIAWPFMANFTCNGSNLPSAKAAGDPPCLKKDNWGWRYTFFTFGAITLACFLARFLLKIPESPKYLVSKGRDAAAVASMRTIASRNGKSIPEGVLSVQILREVAGQDRDQVSAGDTSDGLDKGGWSTMFVGVGWHTFRPSMAHIKPLFSGVRMTYTMSALILTWALCGMGAPLFSAYLPQYLSAHYKVGGASSVDITYRNYAIVSASSLPGAILGAWVADLPNIGRKGGLALGFFSSGAFMFAFTTAKTADANLAFSCVVAFTQQIMYAVLYLFPPELIAAPHRGTGDALCAGANRLAGLFSPLIAIYAKTVSAPLFIGAGMVSCVHPQPAPRSI